MRSCSAASTASSSTPGNTHPLPLRGNGQPPSALIQQSLFVNLLQRPPFGFNKIVVIRHIRMLHIRPKAHLIGKLLPHIAVFPDALFALLNERLQPVLFDLLFSVKTEHFFDFQFHRQPMRIPTGFPRNHIPLHRTVARNHILNHARQHMADMRLSVRGRRPVIKDIRLALFAGIDAFLEDLIVAPELFDRIFAFHEVQIGRYLLIHQKSTPYMKSIVLLDFEKAAFSGKQKKPRPVNGTKAFISLRSHPFRHTIICVPSNAGDCGAVYCGRLTGSAHGSGVIFRRSAAAGLTPSPTRCVRCDGVHSPSMLFDY